MPKLSVELDGKPVDYQKAIKSQVSGLGEQLRSYLQTHPELVAASVLPLLGGVGGAIFAPDKYGIKKRSINKGIGMGALAGAGTVAYANRDALRSFIQDALGSRTKE